MKATRPVAGLLLALFASTAEAAVQAAPLLSRKVAAVGDPSEGLSTLNDGQWNSGTWDFDTGSWVAFNVGPGPSRLLLTWNVPWVQWSGVVGCENGSRACVGSLEDEIPEDYDIQVSSNSTDGRDGVWTTAVSITGNLVSSRGHYVSFAGKSWVKLRIHSGSGGFDEVEVFDASRPRPEGWFFVGNSITDGAWKRTGLSADQTFEALVAQAAPERAPPVIRGGIPCILTVDVANDIARYLDNAEGATLWGISLGTNDAWDNGTSGLGGYRKALIKILDSLQGRGIQPILARFTATDSSVATWQVDRAYPHLIDSLTQARGLTPGPDLFGYFLAHPSELGPDGVHPNDSGYASIQRLWADVADKIPLQANSIAPSTLPVKSLPAGRLYTLDGHRTGVGQSGSRLVIKATVDGAFLVFKP